MKYKFINYNFFAQLIASSILILYTLINNIGTLQRDTQLSTIDFYHKDLYRVNDFLPRHCINNMKETIAVIEIQNILGQQHIVIRAVPRGINTFYDTCLSLYTDEQKYHYNYLNSHEPTSYTRIGETLLILITRLFGWLIRISFELMNRAAGYLTRNLFIFLSLLTGWVTSYIFS